MKHKKTYSRTYWENQYNLLTVYNPLLPAVLPFNDLLTKDLDEVRDTIERISAFNVTHVGMPNVQKLNPELVKNVLAEINDYGHSLVLVESRDTIELNATQDDIMSVITHWDRDVIVNWGDRDYFIRLQGRNSIVTFGNKEYECKHISYISDNKNAELYLPIESTVRLFIASHSSCCKHCKERRCIIPDNGSIKLYWSLDDGLVDTPPKPYDLHKLNCGIAEPVRATILTLGCVLLGYQEQLNRESEERTERDSNKTHTAKESGADCVNQAITEDDSAEEIIVPVRPHYTAVYAQHSGSHKSPVAHTVNGFWRRRSKNDSTKIFVKSFVRGGSEKDKERLRDSIRTKQVVHKL